MLLILKKTIFELIIARYFEIMTVQRNVPRFCIRGQSVDETGATSRLVPAMSLRTTNKCDHVLSYLKGKAIRPHPTLRRGCTALS